MEESLGLRIKLARTRRGLNQAELSRQVGVSRNAMNLIERDRTNPTLATLRRIAALSARRLPSFILPARTFP